MATSSFKVESGIQLLARLSKKPTIKQFYPQLFHSVPKPGEVIELIYSEDSPKHLLIDIICSALMPAKFGGSETSILIFNCSGNLNYDALVTYLTNKCMLKLRTQNEKELDTVIEKQLENLYLLDIQDTNQFYTTIFNLENMLLEHPNITMITFDTITSFYWSEQGFKITKMDTYLRKILLKIQNVTKEHKVIILYSKPDYFTSNKDTLDSWETCNECPTAEGINYKINIMCDKDNTYLASVKSFNKKWKKPFCLKDGSISWI